jgi:hypothetical protein
MLYGVLADFRRVRTNDFLLRRSFEAWSICFQNPAK